MVELQQIYEALEQYIDIEIIRPDSDLKNDQGVFGDDFEEMINKYAKLFNVDMTNYRWYFHMREEGSDYSIGSILFKPPYDRVPYIPVTPQMLVDFANKGKWDIDYPPHKIPKRRVDLLVNFVVVVVFIIFVLYIWMT